MIAATIFVADQITKLMIIGWLRYGESWPVEGFLRFTHARNTGAAFSLFEGQSNILSIVAILAIGLILWLYRTSGGTSILLRLALAFQLGGAFGNLLDRFRYGYVVDFLDVGPWPIFNVADSSISVGIALLIAYVIFGQREEPRPEPDPELDIGERDLDTGLRPRAICETCERSRALRRARLELQGDPENWLPDNRSCPTCNKARTARDAKPFYIKDFE